MYSFFFENVSEKFVLNGLMPPILTKSSYRRRREGEWEDGTEGPGSGGGLRVPSVLTTAQLSPHGRSLQLRLTGLGWTSCSYLLRDQGYSSPHQSGETSVMCIQESHKRWTSSFHECQNHIFHICIYLYITNHNLKQDYYDLEWILLWKTLPSLLHVCLNNFTQKQKTALPEFW